MNTDPVWKIKKDSGEIVFDESPKEFFSMVIARDTSMNQRVQMSNLIHQLKIDGYSKSNVDFQPTEDNKLNIIINEKMAGFNEITELEFNALFGKDVKTKGDDS
ncbi:hypothetical protein ACU6U9_02430 [Pseudomonas sp. HK3]